MLALELLAPHNPLVIAPLFLSYQEQRELVLQWQRGRNRQILERLIASFICLVRAEAGKVEPHCNSLSYEDLVGHGIDGLIHGFRKYKKSYRTRVSTYVTPWVRQAMKRAKENGDSVIRVPVHIHEARAKLATLWNKTYQSEHRSPTWEEMLSATGLNSGQLEAALLGVGECVYSLDEPVTEDQSPDFFVDVVPCDEPHPFDTVGRSVTVDVVQYAWGRLPKKKWRDVIRLRYGLGCPPHTQLAAAEVLRMTKQAVSQAEKRALTFMRPILYRHLAMG
ncbi:MAG TPA: sigma-70 family RNA polymerase sigma factor [Patescibacteria group bacterium]